MKIGIVATHFYPIPSPKHSGEFFILDLVHCLVEMGHEISLFAPVGTKCIEGVTLFEMPCSNGADTPSGEVCEQQCFEMHAEVFRNLDVIHDFSIRKRIAEILYAEGKRNVISSPLGGVWDHPNPSYNIVCSSVNMKDRALRGATDYENTSVPYFGVKSYDPIKNAHVIYYGINTDWYTPTYAKKDYFLWLGRWHEVRGYRMAIEIAKQSGINLIMAGDHPDRLSCNYQKKCAYQAIDLASDVPNIIFEWLPADPYHHEAKREMYRSAKAFINTVQFQEPFGLQQPEALACGTPVICTRIGALPEVISHGITGYLCDNNVEDFVSALKLIDNIDPKVCREHAVMRFDRHIMAKSYLAEYEMINNGINW